MTSASPVFVKSQMPRMHAQNLLTGQWYHRDVQGVTSPNITWNLNAADSFTCTLSPPRPDMRDASGEPLLQEWRDAVYLEENDEIKFGGIVTSSTFNGPQWQLGCTGFGGYPNGIVYEGTGITDYSIDALDAVRFIWAYVQAQPGGNLGVQTGTQKSGVLLGSHVAAGASGILRQSAKAGNTGIILGIGEASGFSAGMRISVNGDVYIIKSVQTNLGGTPTGTVILTHKTRIAHAAGETIQQIQTATNLSKPASSGQNYIWVYDAAGFTASEVILIDGTPNTVFSVATNSAGAATGKLNITGPLSRSYEANTPVVQAPQPWTLYWYNSTDLGQEIQSIQAEAIFDWDEQHTWTDTAKTGVHHEITFGVPRIGSHRTDLRFAEGENIIQPVQVTRDGTKYADSVVGIGAGSGAAQIRSTATSLGGRLRRSYVYTDQTAFTTARVSSEAQKILASMSNIDAATTVVIKNHPNAPFGSFSVGDDIPVQVVTGWRNTTIWSRITALSQDPTSDIMTLTVARSDSYSYLAQSGQAGTIL